MNLCKTQGHRAGGGGRSSFHRRGTRPQSQGTPPLQAPQEVYPAGPLLYQPQPIGAIKIGLQTLIHQVPSRGCFLHSQFMAVESKLNLFHLDHLFSWLLSCAPVSTLGRDGRDLAASIHLG